MKKKLLLGLALLPTLLLASCGDKEEKTPEYKSLGTNQSLNVYDCGNCINYYYWDSYYKNWCRSGSSTNYLTLEYNITDNGCTVILSNYKSSRELEQTRTYKIQYIGTNYTYLITTNLE